MFIDYMGRVYTTHGPFNCRLAKVCVIHKPTLHGMSWWPALMRDDKQYLVERICKHGIGHPDPDSLAYYESKGDKTMGIHGCDTCCSKAMRVFNG